MLWHFPFIRERKVEASLELEENFLETRNLQIFEVVFALIRLLHGGYLSAEVTVEEDFGRSGHFYSVSPQPPFLLVNCVSIEAADSPVTS